MAELVGTLEDWLHKNEPKTYLEYRNYRVKVTMSMPWLKPMQLEYWLKLYHPSLLETWQIVRYKDDP